MKYLIYTFSLLLVTGAFAQEQPVDKVKETKVKTIKTKKNGKTVENKVKVTTTKEQKVMTDPSYKGTIDAPQVFPDVKVTKTVSIDNDQDPFYDSEDKIVFYNKKDKNYKFQSNKRGFLLSDANNERVGKAMRSSNSQYYILDINNYSGVGYFNKDGNFIVEYYDSDTDMMVVEAFEVTSKF
ncbi:MAG: hypothetical protein GYB32_03105 [Algicola sp.]|nr:hypothetical protein [Algicola sp.]